MMPTSVFVLVLIISVVQFDSTDSRTPIHPCGKSKEPISGPLCFLYYDCSFPGERNLIVCPLVNVFDADKHECVVNSTAWIKCLSDLANRRINIDSLVEIVKVYMTPPMMTMFYDIMNKSMAFSQTASNLCSSKDTMECQAIFNQEQCIIPYDDCTGYFNCSKKINSQSIPCNVTEKFDLFTNKCLEAKYASCGLGSSYPSGKRDERLRFCNENQITECEQSSLPKYNCIFSTQCMSYQDCSKNISTRHIECSEESDDTLCKALFSNDCKIMPKVLDESPEDVNILSDKNVFKEGERVELVCKSDLPSIERFVWIMNDEIVNEEDERIQIIYKDNQSTMTINPVHEMDTGHVTCLVEYGQYFNQPSSTYIVVYKVPKITLSPVLVTVRMETNAATKFVCNVDVNEDHFYFNNPISVSWFVNKKMIDQNDFVEESHRVMKFDVSSSVQCCVNMSQIDLICSTLSFITVISEKDTTSACRSETVGGAVWATTKEGDNFTQPCPRHSSGNMMRTCMEGGQWSEINEDECLHLQLNLVSKMLDDLNTTTVNSMKLTQASQQLPNINSTNNNNIINNMTDILFRMCLLRKKAMGGKMEAKMETENVLNALVSVVQAKGWKFNESLKQSSIRLMQTLNIYSSHVWTDKLFTYSFKSFNKELVFERNVMGGNDDVIVFPRLDDEIGRKSQIKLFNKYLFDKLSFNSTISFGASLMKKVANGLMQNTNKSRINSDMISMEVAIQSPLILTEFTLQHIEVIQGYTPNCVYWKFNETLNGYWSRDGCKLIDSNETHTTCRCSHLTNFAILFSPSSASERDSMILSKISIIGCIISIVALLFTIILYGVKWRVLKSKRAVLLLSLCCSLIVANIIFVAGSNQTSDPGGCTAVAILLHYFFLSSFFMMLLLALHLFISVYFVFFTITKKHIVIMLVLGWTLPLIIVAISMGATKLRGYGSELNCWLSIEYGVLWAFVAPALIIITTNMTIAISVLIKICQMKISRLNMKRSKWLSAAQNLVILNPILGLTWIFGVLSVNDNLVAFQYIFTIANSLQGLFIFLLHGVCLKKSLSSQSKKMKEDKQPAEKFSSNKPRHTSTQDVVTKTMKPDEYFVLHNNVMQDNVKSRQNQISSDSFSTDLTNVVSSDK